MTGDLVTPIDNGFNEAGVVVDHIGNYEECGGYVLIVEDAQTLAVGSER